METKTMTINQFSNTQVGALMLERASVYIIVHHGFDITLTYCTNQLDRS